MSTLMRNGLIVAAVHVLMVCSLGGKLLVDRAARPRVWVQTASYDPNLPLRGRYVALQIAVTPDFQVPPYEEKKTPWYRSESSVTLEASGDKLLAHGSSEPTGIYVCRLPSNQAILCDPVEFFIPDTAKDPTWRQSGERLWAEVTVPRKGPPRPIRLGVKKGDGPIEPLGLD